MPSPGALKKHLADKCSVSERTIQTWINRIEKDTIEERNCAIQSLYLRTFTQDEIATAVDVSQPTVNQVLSGIEEFQIPIKVGVFSEAIDFTSEKKRQEYESRRLAKIVEHNRSGARSLQNA